MHLTSVGSMSRRRLLVGTLGVLAAAVVALGALLAGGPPAVGAASPPTVSAAEPTAEGTVAPVDGAAGEQPASPASTLPGGLPAPAGPLVVVPAGCAQPAAAVAVFDGVVLGSTVNVARFEVRRVLAGSIAGYEVAPGVVDVVYGDDVRFLVTGERYTVGVGTDETRLLRSSLRDPRPLFGGDAVIGLDDSDIDCPSLDDPVRTLLADGTPVEAGLLTPLRGSGGELVRAVLIPFVVALGVLLALVVVKHLMFAFGRSLRDSA